MDFSFSEDQQALADLAKKILDDQVTADRLKEVEAGDEWFDRVTWEALGAAGLVGIGLPEAHGGGGLGFLETAIVAEAIGRVVAPVPYVWSTCAADAIARYGTDAQHTQWLPRAATGDTVLTVALQEAQTEPAVPRRVQGFAEGDSWRLTGTKEMVPAWHLAAAAVVSAHTDDGPALFLVETGASGVDAERATATDGQPVFGVTFDRAPAQRLGDGGDLTAVLERVVAAICVTQAGVSEQALRITAEYVSGREQFDHPLASFQAVSQRTADAYIDVEAIRLTAWQAAWRVAEGLPAADEVAIAKFWTSDAGNRVAHTAQHLHGGIGADVDYPAHRYFWWSKMLELSFGGPTAHLRSIGASIADGTISDL